jgi:hypothetical protein
MDAMQPVAALGRIYRNKINDNKSKALFSETSR